MVTIAYPAKNRAQYCRVEPDESEHHITFTILLSSDKSSMRCHNCTTAANPILQEAEDSTEYVHSKKLVKYINCGRNMWLETSRNQARHIFVCAW